MALPIKQSEMLILSEYKLELHFFCGNQKIRVDKLSPDRTFNHVQDTIIEIDEYRPLRVEYFDWNNERSITLNLPLNSNAKDGKWKSFTFSKFNRMHSLFNPSTDDAYPWSCGELSYSVEIDDHIFYGAIRVMPKNMSSFQFMQMHHFLERELKGLTLDFQNKVMQYQRLNDIVDQKQMKLIDWLQSNFSKVISALEWIEQEASGNVQRHYELESRPGHMDKNSMRWQNSFKGSILSNQRFYNRKQSIQLNLPHNQIVKYQTKQIRKAIVELELELQRELQEQKSLCQNLYEEIKELDNDIVGMKVNSLRLRSKKLLIENKKNDLEKYSYKCSAIFKKVSFVSRMKNMMQVKLNQSFWLQIDDIHPRVPQCNMQKGFVLFKRLWNDFQSEGLEAKTRLPLSQVDTTPMFQTTAKLYEYYSYILIIKQLNKNGFVLQHESLSKQLQQGYVNSELQSGTTVTLMRENLKLDIVYDEEVAFRSKEAIEDKTYFFSRFRKRKPDIRIDLYKKDLDKNNFLYKSSIVFEVKYRPLPNIYSEDGDSEAMDQMNEYIGIKYYCPHRKEFFSRIREVVCLYPSYRDVPICLNTEAGKFIQLYPKDEQTIIGITEIENLLENWITGE